MSTEPSQGISEIVALAGRCSKSRPGVASLAERVSSLDPDATVSAALDAMDEHAGTMLALAFAVRGQTLSDEVLLRVLDETDDFELLGVLTLNSSRDLATSVAHVLAADRVGSERESVIALCAIHAPVDTDSLRPLLNFLRRLEQQLSPLSAATPWIAAALDYVMDATLGAAPNSARPPAPPWFTIAQGPVLDALPPFAAPRVVSGVTVRRAESKLGRNDPCHCGSGKKYKKCCAGNDDGQLTGESAIGLTRRHFEPGHAHLIGDDQFELLRPHALARLDPAELTRQRLVAGMRQLATFRRWETAERWVEVLTSEHDADGSWWEDLAMAALQAGNLDLAQRCRDRCGMKEAQQELDLQLMIARQDSPLLAAFDLAVYGDLVDDHWDKLGTIAHALLEHYPALGVVFARGCLTPKRPFDSSSLLESIEEARVKIDLEPEDPSEEMWHAWVESEETEHASEQALQQAATIRALRERLQSSSREVIGLRAQLPELQKKLDAAQKAPRVVNAPLAVPATDPAELKRLRSHVEELEGLIKEGSKERQQLRQELREAHKSVRSPGTGQADATTTFAAEDEVELDIDTTPLRQPLIAPAQVQELAALDGDLGKRAMVRLGELASGSAAAWHQTKRLRVGNGLLSSRLGIHHRLLFRATSTTLEFVELIHRKELERFLG